MQVVLRCVSDHCWTNSGPCPVCGLDAVTISEAVSGANTGLPDHTLVQGSPSRMLNPVLGRFPIIPDYTILAEIGSGGMGVVYKATHNPLGREVALKVIRSGELAQSNEQKRFLMEAEVVARLRHANIVQVYDVGVVEGRPFYTMELIAGTSLESRLEAGPLPDREAAKLCAAVARAADCAHQQGVIHRDLKPANILIADDGTPKLVDFGIAKRMTATDGLTRTGTPIGTPEYMAPEQAAGLKDLGPGVDIYAIGVILYKLLAGRVPFSGGTLYDVLHQIITVEPLTPARHRADIPRDLETICLKCLSKQPANRYASAAHLADDLDRFLNHEKISVGWTSPWRLAVKWYRRRPALAASLAFGLLLVGGLSFVFVFYKPATPEVAEAIEDPGVKLRREEVFKRVESLLRSPPSPDRESPHTVTVKPTLPTPDLTSFEVTSDHRDVDLRAWRPLATGTSYVVYQSRRTLIRTGPARTYETEYRTTGRDLVVRAKSPNPEQAIVLASEAPGQVGGQAMKVRQLSLDVSREPLHSEFTVQTMATFVDSLQKPEDQWFGLIGYKGSLRSSMLILFPKDRPFKTISFQVAPKRDAPMVPFTGPVISFQGADRDWLYWEVGSPDDGHVYRVDWTW